MLFVVRCECGEEHMDLKGICPKCGKDRLLGSGQELVKWFVKSLRGLRKDQRDEAARLLSAWLADGVEP